MLQERTIHRVGGNEEIKVDVRLVAATKTDLLEAASRREFREDLYFRLGVAELFIPPLNERREDIPLLFTHFLQDFAHSYGRGAPRLAREDLERLMAHNWRGNVRELRILPASCCGACGASRRWLHVGPLTGDCTLSR